MIRRTLSIVALHLLFAAGCAAQSGWTPTVDTFGSSRAQYLARDQAECRELATQTSGGTGGSAVRGAVTGGAVGAAGGAAVGAIMGNAGRGAALGAAVGGIGRGAQQAGASNAQFQQAFRNCLRNRGHNVIN
jgi:outer membrane lipoprotein SlyB